MCLETPLVAQGFLESLSGRDAVQGVCILVKYIISYTQCQSEPIILKPKPNFN